MPQETNRLEIDPRSQRQEVKVAPVQVTDGFSPWGFTGVSTGGLGKAASVDLAREEVNYLSKCSGIKRDR